MKEWCLIKNYKKMISFSLVLSFVVLCFCGCEKNSKENLKEIEQPSSYYEDDSTLRSDLTWPSIYIGDVTASKNDSEVSAVVYVVNNPGIAGALLRFYYDDVLTLVKAEPGKAFSSLEYTPPGQYSNPCNFSWDSENGMATENGAILALTFKLPEDVQPGKHYEIRCSFRDSDIYDENLNDVSIGTEIGTITIK